MLDRAKTRVTVDVSDAKVSDDPADVLVTYSLGSCIGICLYDPLRRLGGMLHYQLPDSKMDTQCAKGRPFMFADTGMKILLDTLICRGADKKRMQVIVVGGSEMGLGPHGFNIGKRNYLAIRRILWGNGMFVDAEDVGGSSPRSLYLDIADGTVTVRCDGQERTFQRSCGPARCRSSA